MVIKTRLVQKDAIPTNHRIGRCPFTLAEYMFGRREVTIIYKTRMIRGTIIHDRFDFAFPHRAAPMSLQNLNLSCRQ
jgi:hypothetical protein